MVFNTKQHFALRILFIIFFCVLGITACGKKKKENASRRAVSVIIEQVKKGSLDKFLKLNGTLEARSAVDVFPDVPGKVDRVMKYEGKYVEKDETIMLIDRSQVGATFNLYPVKAPAAGHITAVRVNPGQTVNPAMPVAGIGDISRIDISINVPEKWIPEIKEGQEVSFSVMAITEKTFAARVYRMDYAINPMSQTLLVRATLENPGNVLLPGMYADVSIKTKSASDMFIIPSSALVIMPQGSGVYTAVSEITNSGGVTNWSVRLKAVTVAFTSDTSAAISAGLGPSDHIVVFGREFLSDGAAINIISQE